MALLATFVASLGFCLSGAILGHMAFEATVVTERLSGHEARATVEGKAYQVGVPAFGQFAAWCPTEGRGSAETWKAYTRREGLTATAVETSSSSHFDQKFLGGVLNARREPGGARMSD